MFLIILLILFACLSKNQHFLNFQIEQAQERPSKCLIMYRQNQCFLNVANHFVLNYTINFVWMSQHKSTFFEFPNQTSSRATIQFSYNVSANPMFLNVANHFVLKYTINFVWMSQQKSTFFEFPNRTSSRATIQMSYNVSTKPVFFKCC